MRIGLVTDKKIIKKYKAQYGSSWFQEGSSSTLVLKRYDGRYFSYDLLSDNPNSSLMFWINKKSLRDVEEMSVDSFKVFEMVRKPVVIAFVDMNSKDKKVRQDSIRLVDEVLTEVAPAFFHGVVLTYADNTKFYKHRKLLGLTHDK